MRHQDRRVFDVLLNYIHDHLGFRFTIFNRSKLETKLGAMRLPDQWPDLDAFRQALQAGNQEAHDLLVRTITVNHTYFFREKAQIETMASLIKSQKLSVPLIWSAASSTGEEAYSIAIHLMEQGIDSFKVVASDINPKVLHQMNRGIYHENRLEKLPRFLLLKYFTKEEEGYWRLAPALRQRVAIKKVNLVDPIAFQNPFDFIFCRNVFIYFDDFSRDRVIKTLSNNLKVGGYLFLGLTEALLEVPSGFVMESHASYRRVADMRGK